MSLNEEQKYKIKSFFQVIYALDDAETLKPEEIREKILLLRATLGQRLSQSELAVINNDNFPYDWYTGRKIFTHACPQNRATGDTGLLKNRDPVGYDEYRNVVLYSNPRDIKGRIIRRERLYSDATDEGGNVVYRVYSQGHHQDHHAYAREKPGLLGLTAVDANLEEPGVTRKDTVTFAKRYLKEQLQFHEQLLQAQLLFQRKVPQLSDTYLNSWKNFCGLRKPAQKRRDLNTLVQNILNTIQEQEYAPKQKQEITIGLLSFAEKRAQHDHGRTLITKSRLARLYGTFTKRYTRLSATDHQTCEQAFLDSEIYQRMTQAQKETLQIPEQVARIGCFTFLSRNSQKAAVKMR